MSTYWSRRQAQLAAALEKDEAKLKKRLTAYYSAEYSALDKEIAAYYQKYGVNNVIEYRRLLETLPDADKRLLIERMDDFAEKYPQYKSLLPVRESIYKLDRLEGLQYSVRLHQLNIGAITNEEVAAHLKRQALRGANAATEAMGFGKNFYSERSDIVNKFVGTEWSNGKDFSTRIWENTDKLAGYLNTDIAQGFARGESYEKLTQHLQQRFENVSQRDAYRLIYTEGTYVMNEASIAAFEEDFDYYKLSPVRDGKTCSVCVDVSRSTFEIKNRQPGVNFPPMHPYCRCRFEIVVIDRKKWLDDYVEKHQNDTARMEEINRRFAEKLLNQFADHGTIETQKKRYRVTDAAIAALQRIEVQILDAAQSEALLQAQKELLQRVQALPDETEMAAYYDTDMGFIRYVSGSSGRSRVAPLTMYRDYITMHNHPSGGTMGLDDVSIFVRDPHLRVLVIVGNNGSQYLIEKTKNFNSSIFADYYDLHVRVAKMEIPIAEKLEICAQFLKEGEKKYGYIYREIVR